MKTLCALLLGVVLATATAATAATAADLACPALAPHEWAEFEPLPTPKGLTTDGIRRGFGTNWFHEPLIFLDEEGLGSVKGFRRTLTGADAEFSRLANGLARQLGEHFGMCVAITCHGGTCEVFAVFATL